MQIDVSQLTREVAKQLKIYTEDVGNAVSKATNEVTKEGIKMLQTTSPKSPKGGDYQKGWARKKDGTGYVIHNKTDYQLTHLLEYGHAKVNGGRVPAIPHIRPVEEQLIKDFEELVKKAIQS